MQSKTAPSVVISLKNWQWFFIGALVTFMVMGGLSACYQGRDIARWTGRPVNVDLPSDLASYDKIVNISFHKNSDGETLKDITYMGMDGKLHSREYKDWGLLEGEIIWHLTAERE